MISNRLAVFLLFFQENCLLNQLPEPCIVLQRDCNIPGSAAAGMRPAAVVVEGRSEDRTVPVGNILIPEGIKIVCIFQCYCLRLCARNCLQTQLHGPGRIIVGQHDRSIMIGQAVKFTPGIVYSEQPL